MKFGKRLTLCSNKYSVGIFDLPTSEWEVKNRLIVVKKRILSKIFGLKKDDAPKRRPEKTA
jgi:hypothetical protein